MKITVRKLIHTGIFCFDGVKKKKSKKKRKFFNIHPFLNFF